MLLPRLAPVLSIRFLSIPLLCAALLAQAATASAQTSPSSGSRPIDALTGEPVQPWRAHRRPEPHIFNAPHAPRQAARTPADDPPIDILVTPPIGADAAGALPDRVPTPFRRY